MPARQPASQPVRGREDLGRINMNGRMYDPELGRVISGDPLINNPGDWQSYNGYTYAENSPLVFTDPSGYSSSWVGFRDNGLKPIAAIVAYYFLGPKGALAVFGETVAGSATVAQGLNAFIAGSVAGGIQGGTLKSAFQGGVSSLLTFGAGQIAGVQAADGTISGLGLTESSPGRALLHVVAGCASASMEGGDCGNGFITSAFTQFAASNVDLHTSDLGPNIAKFAVIGGTSALITGGDFANGAVTASFQYMLSGAARATANGGFDGLVDFVGKVWSLPNTALGLAVGSVDILGTLLTTGEVPIIGIGNDPLQISNQHIGPSGGITVGNIQLYTGYDDNGKPIEPNYLMQWSPYTDSTNFRLGSHEQAHSLQSQFYGPLFFPLYFLQGGVSKNNSFETQADIFAKTGKNPIWSPFR